MTDHPRAPGLPLAHSYNLARLGNAGDEVTITADSDQRAAIARWAGIVALGSFEAKIAISKQGISRFGLTYRLTADVVQSCVVTLEPVESRMDHGFARELHFIGPVRHKLVDDDSGPDLVLDSEEERPEEIESLHYDLAGPLLEEFVLSLEPYPRRPGVEFSPKTEEQDRPESPFAVLKGLK
ncbi:MAG TPA: YceD family protein [Rhizomicrobium sp.]|jgi:uncharacterized metal-binding protein YceD (DUF177 family)|nr:YceD family protein [Rhizomicrobium sp.]